MEIAEKLINLPDLQRGRMLTLAARHAVSRHRLVCDKIYCTI